jgi:squalene synthase HpnC
MAVGHYENFPVASVLLPPRLRAPIWLIYRFAREADDFADEGTADAAIRLGWLDDFRQDLRRIEAGAEPRIEWFSDLGATIRAHRLPIGAFHDLLSAFSQDVVQTRYPDYDDLRGYCQRSANPIGRLLLALYGAENERNLQWSDAICSSLQLINFLQDVPIDYAKGRIYLPLDEMQQHGVSEQQIAHGQADDAWTALMRFQIERARRLLCSGAPLGRALEGRIGLEMRMIVAGGLRVLEKLERIGGDVFRERPVLKVHDWAIMFLRALR